MTPELAEEIRRAAGANPDAPRLSHSAGDAGTSGAGFGSTDWYPDLSCGSTIAARRAGTRATSTSRSRLAGRPGRLQHELQHYAYRDVSHHLATIDRYTTLAAEQWIAEGRRTSALEAVVHPPLAFLRNYVLRGGFRDGAAGLLVSGLNSYYVFLKLAKLWELQQQAREAGHPMPIRTNASRSAASCQPVRSPKPRRRNRVMFSLHIDTARTWRGGQNQVLVTVMGLRALGHRTMLVAHPGGELRQRAKEGLDLIPLAPKTEMDLSAAWRLSRMIKQLKPDIVHAHDPHGVAMAALALSMSTQLAKPPLVAARRVDFHLRGSSLSRWKYRQVDCFICASEAIRQMLDRRRRAGRRAPSRCTRASTSSAWTPRRPPSSTRSSGCPHHAPIVGNVAALVPHKGQRHLIEAARAGPAAGAGCAVRHRRRRRAAAGARAPDPGSSSREARAARSASGPTCCRCTRRSTSSS